MLTGAGMASQKGASKAERDQVTVAAEVPAAAPGREFQLGQEQAEGAEVWEDLQKYCPGNVGQCQQLHALQS